MGKICWYNKALHVKLNNGKQKALLVIQTWGLKNFRSFRNYYINDKNILSIHFHIATSLRALQIYFSFMFNLWFNTIYFDSPSFQTRSWERPHDWHAGEKSSHTFFFIVIKYHMQFKILIIRCYENLEIIITKVMKTLQFIIFN